MKKSDFWFDLPETLIAQTPIEPRDHSRLLVINRSPQIVAHRHFYNILDYVRAGDVLVINDSKVLPARIFGRRESGGKMEMLLLKQRELDVWEVLLKPAKRAHIGDKLMFGDGALVGEVREVLETGERVLAFSYEGNFYDVIDRIGEMPLPHYIKESLADKSRYQTVYAEEEGSAAAPTAGLHFTKELLEKIRAEGVEIVHVTLHVGLGTFRPVQTDDIADHHMHTEHYEISSETANIINAAKRDGRRVIAVGTTSCRTLESAAVEKGKIVAGSGDTNIFISPGYDFRIVDAIITNFHLPESTLIMLISAFAGQKFTMAFYEEAIQKKYRFYSFGDAMFIT